MNGIHDMGGMHGMGPIQYEKNEPVHHAEWEGRVDAMTTALRGKVPGGPRAGIEQGILAADYLRMSYYERWYESLVWRLLAAKVATRAEMESGRSAEPKSASTRAYSASEADSLDDLPIAGGLVMGCASDRALAIDVRPRDHDQLIDGGRSLQPLFYALAAEKLFAGQATVSSGRLYFCTSAGGFGEQIVPLDGQARAAAIQVAEAVGEAVAHGFLPAAPGERQCDLCDYRIVCGPHEERRAGRKPQERLDPLLVVRASP